MINKSAGFAIKAATQLACTLAILACVVAAQATEYFVGKQGHDGNDGKSKTQAFATIQKGLDAIQAGDTLTIGPGEYFENVSRAGLGSSEVDTVIRSEIPGMAVLRGDVPAPEFRKVDGYRFVYAARLDQAPKAVLEHHELHTLLPKANVAELEFDPGHFHYDTSSRTIYLSNPDLSPPDRRRYTLAVNGNHGFELTGPKRVIIEGLAATGFYPSWGINLNAPVSCIVRDCVTFMSVGGIRLGPAEGIGGDGGACNVIERCESFGHTFGGIVRYGANDDTIRNCRTYRSRREGEEHFGIMHYAGMDGPLRIANNISWGQNFDYSVKPIAQETLENCVALGFVRNARMSHNLIGGGNEYDRSFSAPADNILFRREQNLDQDFEFADPLNLDFRLQSDSRFRGTAPDHTDRGPYPYAENVFYLAADGDDQAAGLSMRTPWRTLNRAFRNLSPGDTLYLAEGRYPAAPLDQAGDGRTPIRICGRGRGTVVIDGTLSLTGGAGIAFERLNFTNEAVLSDSRDVSFTNCTFFGPTGGLKADKSSDLNIRHSVFAGVPLRLSKTAGVILSGNVYANSGTPAVLLDSSGSIRYSDYNSYQDAAHCWQIGPAMRSLTDLRHEHEQYSQTLAVEFAHEQGVPRLENEDRFKSLGPHSTSLGLYHAYEVAPDALDLVGPFLHSAHDTTANIEWWSSHPANFALVWSETGDATEIVRNVRGPHRFNTFSLSGLKPGHTYQFRIRSVEATVKEGVQRIAPLSPESAQLTFTTNAAAEPQVYYVAPDGDDAHSGLTRTQAFRTVNRAATRVGPGDTVMIAGGEYAETVRIRAAGTKERPISFRSLPGEKVVFNGENLGLAFGVIVKPDLRFDGFYFEGFDGFNDQVFAVRQSERIQITRCLNVRIDADESGEMLVRNCVARGGWTAVALSRSPDSLVENNVFIMTILRHLVCDAPTTVRGNIFCECIRNKAHQTLLELSANVTEANNCFYLRWPEDEKLAINSRPLTEYRVRTGSDAMAANPMMPGTPGRLQGWQQSDDQDFDRFFATNPQLIRRGIGLQPEAFGDFRSDRTTWVYDRAWAEAVSAATNEAEELTRSGKDAEALAAYADLAAKFRLSERLKADVLEQASLCAGRLKDYDRAMQLAKDIPLQPISIRRQMQLMLEQKQYAELLEAFTNPKMGGRSFYQSFLYPEQEDLMADLYYYRSIAYRETGNLAAAEADLRIMNDKRTQLTYRSGEAIHDLAWLRLGNFYRQYLKDDERALAAYQNVLDRITWAPWGQPRKPAATGASETLVAATNAVSDILRKRGKQDEIRELRFNLLLSQAEAAASMLKTDEMIARLKESLALPGKFSSEMEAAAIRILALEDDYRLAAVNAAGTMAAGLTDDLRSLLIQTASASETSDRKIAVRALVMFAPRGKIRELLDENNKAEHDARVPAGK